MKQLLLILFLLASVSVSAQDKQLYVEITDTVETAYHSYHEGWKQEDGFHMIPVVKKDSIGVDSVRIIRAYYWKKQYIYTEFKEKDTVKHYSFTKKYIYEKREYPNGNSSYYDYFNY